MKEDSKKFDSDPAYIALKNAWQMRKSEAPKEYSQSRFADYADISQSAVSQYLNAAIPLNYTILCAFSRFLEVPLVELDPNHHYSKLNVLAAQETPRRYLDQFHRFEKNRSRVLQEATEIRATVPLISSVQAGNWSEAIDNFQPGDAEDWVATTTSVSKNAFALRVVGDSMTNPTGSPSIPDGFIVIIDPEATCNNGSIVVAKLEDQNEVTLKKYVIDGSNKYLMPLNPKYNPIEINDNCTIVGVAKTVHYSL